MKADNGFTLIEILVTLAILGILAALAFPAYTTFVDKTNTSDVSSDFAVVDLRMETYYAANGQYPPDLATIGMNKDDPWDNPYQFLNMAAEGDDSNKRKDGSSDPINSDYDLYSKGPDGASSLSVTAANSKDDIIRADNGAFIGTAADY